jgi:hypothetical protein
MTILISVPTDIDDTCGTRLIKTKLTGMVVPYMQTGKGKVVVGY